MGRKETISSIEPFVMLPLGKMQDVIFFANDALQIIEPHIKYMVYRDIPNKIIKDNIIKVVVQKNAVFIFHIYPTNYKEVGSNRTGQNLVIGYIVSKKLFRKNIQLITMSVTLFFEHVRKCCNLDYMSRYDVLTKLLYLANAGHKNEYILSCLKNARREMQSIFQSMPTLRVEISSVQINQRDRLIFLSWLNPKEKELRIEIIYKYIRKLIFIYKDFWMFIDAKDYTYYDDIRGKKVILKKCKGNSV